MRKNIDEPGKGGPRVDGKPHNKHRPRQGEGGFVSPKSLRPDGEPWRVQEKKQPLLQATLWGTHAVQEAWANPARRVKKLYIAEQMLAGFEPLLRQVEAQGLDRPTPTMIDKKDLDRRLPPGAVHQGLALDADPLDEVFVQDLIAGAARAERSVILMLDQVTDPHNVGAILRTGSAFGADGVVMQRRHSPELTGALAKAACGAVEHLPVAYETNLSRALELLQQAGYTAIALDEHAQQSLHELPLPAKSVLLLGAEGAGLRQKLREQCNAMVRLPTQGAIQSLNVSNAAAVALYALTRSIK
jgi:23S rRNA (guanosine2251-2'-O)-methyltransferase